MVVVSSAFTAPLVGSWENMKPDGSSVTGKLVGANCAVVTLSVTVPLEARPIKRNESLSVLPAGTVTVSVEPPDVFRLLPNSSRDGSPEVRVNATAWLEVEGSWMEFDRTRSFPTVSGLEKLSRAGTTVSNCCLKETGSAKPAGTLKRNKADPGAFGITVKDCV